MTTTSRAQPSPSSQARSARTAFTSGASTTSRLITAGSVFTVPAAAIHRVLHGGRGPAVTIHACSPPLVRSGVYRTGPGGELLREVRSIEEELRTEEQLRTDFLTA
jgi:hypothetical protein